MQLRWGEILCMQASVLSWNSWDFNSCPEIFSMSWIFCRCPEIFEHTCRWYTCKSLTDYMARRAEVNKLSYFWECCIYISFREWTPCPCEPQTQLWTLKTEGHTRYSYCDTAEGIKQTAHLCYWFRVTTVFLDDFSGTFSACLYGSVSWKMSWNFKILLSRKNFFTTPKPVHARSWELMPWVVTLFVGIWRST